jgi:hypothetical protein
MKSLDEEAEEGAKKARELLANPAEFEKWANRTLDMSGMRGEDGRRHKQPSPWHSQLPYPHRRKNVLRALKR